MTRTIIIKDDCIEILRSGYNIIDRIVYDDELVIKAHKLLKDCGVHDD